MIWNTIFLGNWKVFESVPVTQMNLPHWHHFLLIYFNQKAIPYFHRLQLFDIFISNYFRGGGFESSFRNYSHKNRRKCSFNKRRAEHSIKNKCKVNHNSTSLPFPGPGRPFNFQLLILVKFKYLCGCCCSWEGSLYWAAQIGQAGESFFNSPKKVSQNHRQNSPSQCKNGSITGS